MSANHERIAWVDVLKFFGIWAIYIGHFGNHAGQAYPFVFTYDVPLFFLAAGFFSTRYLKDSPLVFIRKKTMQLMVPYVIFSILALTVFTIQNDWNILQVKSASMGFILGIREHILAGSLWFFPCLYIIIVGDYFVMKLFKSQAIALVVAIGTFLISQTLLPNNPANNPSWFMNLDSALFYYIYYSLGAVIFPFINRETKTTFYRATRVVFTVIAGLVTVITFFLTPHWFFGKIGALFPAINTFKLSTAFFNVLIALVIIYFNIAAAKFLAHISFLGTLGRETLAFCGTEDVAKIMITQLLAMVNLKVRLINPFVTIAFAFICLVVSKYVLIEFLNTHFPWAVGKTYQAIRNMDLTPAPSIPTSGSAMEGN